MMGELPRARRMWARVLRAGILLALLLVAAVVPTIAIVLVEIASPTLSGAWQPSLATLTALAICPLVAFRTGSLRDYFLGTAAAMLAGFFDLHVTLMLYRAGFSVASASLAPAWGAVLGLWIASGHRRRHRPAVLIAMMLADFIARLVWMGYVGPELESGSSPLDEWAFLLSALTFSPSTVLAIALARRRAEAPPAIRGGKQSSDFSMATPSARPTACPVVESSRFQADRKGCSFQVPGCRSADSGGRLAGA